MPLALTGEPGADLARISAAQEAAERLGRGTVGKHFLLEGARRHGQMLRQQALQHRAQVERGSQITPLVERAR